MVYRSELGIEPVSEMCLGHLDGSSGPSTSITTYRRAMDEHRALVESWIGAIVDMRDLNN